MPALYTQPTHLEGRTCTACGTYYSDKQSNFHWNKKGQVISSRCKPCFSIYINARYRANPAPQLTRQKAEAYKSNQKAYRKMYSVRLESRNLFRVYRQKYRAAKLAGAEHFTKEQWNALCEQYGQRCLACGRLTLLTADHVVPLSRGGSNGIGNIQPLCRSCNSSKGAKTIDYRR